MRADRLVALLMLLQQRGRVTAAEVAQELEISERTARRDLDALGMAGVPVYSRQGRNGGWELIGGARTDLSGLTSAEARALFLVAGPASSATPEVKAALRKLVSALPETFRSDAEAASAAIVVDPTAWGATGSDRPAPVHLGALQDAVINGVQVTLGYTASDGNESTRVVHPLGLATKRAVWYLVADTAAGLRTFKVERVTAVEPTGEPVVRPEGFDLAEAWKMVTDRFGDRWASIAARGSADPTAVELLRMVLGRRLRIGSPDADGRIPVEVAGGSTAALAGELAGFGSALRIDEPAEVVERLAEIGAELVAAYG